VSSCSGISHTFFFVSASFDTHVLTHAYWREHTRCVDVRMIQHVASRCDNDTWGVVMVVEQRAMDTVWEFHSGILRAHDVTIEFGQCCQRNIITPS
jgi:hypothetical protein